jgi:hypothetical protein
MKDRFRPHRPTRISTYFRKARVQREILIKMSTSDSDDADIPDRQTCEVLCKEFAHITNTDTACAQFYLQDRKWKLEVLTAPLSQFKDEIYIFYF